jgi:hypothetical protein
MIIIRVRETKKIPWLNLQGASGIDTRFSHPPTAQNHYQHETQAAASFITPVLITIVYLPLTMNGLL